MTFNCTCTRCGGTGEGVTVQQAKFSCHHKVGCGRKIGILEWNTATTATTTATTGDTTLILKDPTFTVTSKPKKKKKKKKVEE